MVDMTTARGTGTRQRVWSGWPEEGLCRHVILILLSPVVSFGGCWPRLGEYCWHRSLTAEPRAEFSAPGSSTGPHVGLGPLMPHCN